MASDRKLEDALKLAQVASEQLHDEPAVNDTLGWIVREEGHGGPGDSVPGELPPRPTRPTRNSATTSELAYYKGGDWPKARRELEAGLKTAAHVGARRRRQQDARDHRQISQRSNDRARARGCRRRGRLHRRRFQPRRRPAATSCWSRTPSVSLPPKSRTTMPAGARSPARNILRLTVPVVEELSRRDYEQKIEDADRPLAHGELRAGSHPLHRPDQGHSSAYRRQRWPRWHRRERRLRVDAAVPAAAGHRSPCRPLRQESLFPGRRGCRHGDALHPPHSGRVPGRTARRLHDSRREGDDRQGDRALRTRGSSCSTASSRSPSRSATNGWPRRRRTCARFPGGAIACSSIRGRPR